LALFLWSILRAARRLIKTDKSDESIPKIDESRVMISHIVRKKETEAKILYKNQRSPAEQGTGPFE
jgi:hypothetical protein